MSFYCESFFIFADLIGKGGYIFGSQFFPTFLCMKMICSVCQDLELNAFLPSFPFSQ